MSTLVSITDRCYNLIWRQMIATIEAWFLGIQLVGTRVFHTGLSDNPKRIEGMDQAAIILDLRNRIVLANPVARRQFFQGRSFILGRQICAMLPWLENAINLYVRSNEHNQEISYQEDGLKRTYEVQVAPIRNAHHQVVGRLAVIHEVSSEKIATEALALAEAKSELLAKVSHELRTPLTSIISIGEMLDYGVYGPLSPEQKDAIRLLSECTQTMTRLVNDLLEQSHLERDDFILEETDFILEDVVNRLRKTARPKATSKGLWLTFDISPEMPTVLHGDPFRLFQVVQNLVDNAIKYTATGTVAVKFYRNNDNYFSVQVADTGMGIPVEMQKLIFNPFQQVHGFIDDSIEKGFGLGLSIVKQLVALMKGDIRVVSETGKGSCFTVKLPIQVPLEIRQ